MPSSCLTYPALLTLVGIAAGIGAPACGGGAGLGEHCNSVSDCASGLQCLDHTCVPRCTRNYECGDGHVCDSGVCREVSSQIGNFCDSEYDCGPGQSCQLADEDIDDNGYLIASCQLENAGGVLDDPCADDEDCRTGTCVLGRCVDVCLDQLDCPESHTCATIPRETVDASDSFALFYGCLPALGEIGYRLPITQAYTHFLLPVPGNARSVALVAEIDDATELVGAAYLRAPETPIDEPEFRLADTREGYFANAIRSDITRGAWTLILPQSPDLDLEDVYVVELGSWIDHQTPGSSVPRVEAIYELEDEADTLDIHFYFLGLANHPCPVVPGDPEVTLDATTAQTLPAFQEDYLEPLNLILANAGIFFDRAAATYADITTREDLDGLDAAKLGDLLELSDQDGGISVFFVRTISPAGVQALVGGPPGPPGRAGTRASGVAIALDTLCYRDWSVLARTTAHEIARSLGLHRSVEPDGYTDPIESSDFSTTNLMYFGESGGGFLDDGQKEILGRSPALR